MSIKTRLANELKQAEVRGATADEIARIQARGELELVTSRGFDRWNKRAFSLISEAEWNNTPAIDINEISKRCRPVK